MTKSPLTHLVLCGILGLSFAAGDPLAAQDGPKRHFVVQADIEKIGKHGGDGKGAEQAIEASVDIIKRRLGVGANSVHNEGGGRIIIELSEGFDREVLARVLGVTEDVEFRMVDLDATPEDIEQGSAPRGSEILQMQDGSKSFAIKRLGGINGVHLVDARQGIDYYTSEPNITLRFDKEGAEKLAHLTRDNVGVPMAIVLDGKVISAPVINEPILDGSLQISGNFTVQSARTFAISLRSGALPVPFEIVDERLIE